MVVLDSIYLQDEVEKMKFFIDFEFMEDGQIIDPLSVGVVAQDGREYYAEFSGARLEAASPWVRENVFRHLRKRNGVVKPKEEIACEIFNFVSGAGRPEFWGYYADYDWVALCQLYGRMVDLPKGWPKYCRDLKQLLDDKGNPPLQKTKNEHHALADARWIKNAYFYLMDPASDLHVSDRL